VTGARLRAAGRTALVLLAVILKLTLILALANRNAANFVYAGY
jgi:hypothetical protein